MKTAVRRSKRILRKPKKFRRKFKSTSLTKKIEHVIRNKTEAAHHSVWDITATTMYHGNVYTSSLLTEIAQGTSNSTRLGDEIYLEAFKTKFMILTAPTSTTVAYRVMLIKSGLEFAQSYSGAWQTATLGLPASGLFFNTNPGGDYNYPGRGIVNPKICTVLYDQVFEFNNQITSQNIAKNVSVTIPIKSKHIYNQTTSYAKFKNIYWVVMAYQNGGTAGATNCGNFSMQTDVIFKNEA